MDEAWLAQQNCDYPRTAQQARSVGPLKAGLGLGDSVMFNLTTGMQRLEHRLGPGPCSAGHLCIRPEARQIYVLATWLFSSSSDFGILLTVVTILSMSNESDCFSSFHVIIPICTGIW